MSRYFSSGLLIPSLLWIVLSLFSVPAGAVNPPGSYGGAAIASGFLHNVAIKSNTTVWTWGNNKEGQLGNGTTSNSYTPVQAVGISNATAGVAGGWYSVTLKSDGTVWTWGNNSHGQLGDGTNINRVTSVQVDGLNNIIAIANGDSHTVALKRDGTVWTWGNNTDGQLGDGTNIHRYTPVQTIGINNITAIAANGWHSVALAGNGTVWTWGNNDSGQLGDGTTINRITPVQIIGLGNVTAIAAGGHHTAILKSDGTVWAWGKNTEGQLGDGTIVNRYTPIQVTGLSGISTIAVGGWHSVALSSDSSVWAWGKNAQGQLGDGTTTDSSNPIHIEGLKNVAAITAGGLHTVALKVDGTVWAWGLNDNGQLGDGTTTDRHTPVQVLGPGSSGYLNLLNSTTPPTTVNAVEFYHAGKDHYFNTANPGDIAYLEANSQSGWFKTGYTFQVYSLNAAPSGTVAVARYYGAQQPDGIYKPDSHFYTGSASERQGLDNRYREVCPQGQGSCAGEAWYFEKDEYRVFLPSNGTCSTGTYPVYRFYNNGYPAKDSNHRYTADTGAAAEMRAKGWQDEGVRMCAQTPGAPPACTYDVSPTSSNFPSGGGTGQTNVSAQTSCSWTATSNDPWITIPDGSKNGTGPGVVTFSVLANTSGATRSGTLTIANQPVTISQAADSGGGDGGGGGGGGQ